MDTMICPYCECRVPVNEVDDLGGECPECGHIITPSHLIEQDRAAEAFEEDLDVDKVDDEDIELEDEDE